MTTFPTDTPPTAELKPDEQPAPAAPPPEEVERGLGFTDGFQFGCGFWAAGIVAALVLSLLAALIMFLLSSLGVQWLF